MRFQSAADFQEALSRFIYTHFNSVKTPTANRKHDFSQRVRHSDRRDLGCYFGRARAFDNAFGGSAPLWRGGLAREAELRHQDGQLRPTRAAAGEVSTASWRAGAAGPSQWLLCQRGAVRTSMSLVLPISQRPRVMKSASFMFSTTVFLDIFAAKRGAERVGYGTSAALCGARGF